MRVAQGFMCKVFLFVFIQSTAQHVANGYTGNVQECEEVWQEWHRAMCAKCVELGEEKQLMSFTSKM